jgi:ABC-type spermidine/putrescine transport system permease subunit I
MTTFKLFRYTIVMGLLMLVSSLTINYLLPYMITEMDTGKMLAGLLACMFPIIIQITYTIYVIRKVLND